jgi:thiol-disulfide isomerase/thioredoxin
MTSGRQKLLIVGVMFGLFSACNSCRKQTPPPANSSPAGKSLPTPRRITKLGSMEINNQRMTLDNFKGKVVVLDFYATWCEPCRAETPHLVKLQQQYSNQGLQIIGLNVGGEDDRDKVPAYAKEFSIQYLLGFPDDDFADQFLGDNQNIPQSFLFDRNGDLIKRFIGYDETAGAELERLVQGALAAKSSSSGN